VTTFNIGSQRADVITNVGGDMFVGVPADMSAQLTRFARELERADLPAETKLELRSLLRQASADSDPRRVGTRLQQVTRILDGVGGVAQAGIGAVEALKALAPLVAAAL
jgi:hypothetical protein